MTAPAFENRVKRRFGNGQVALCMQVRLSTTTDMAMIADACGFDAFYVDMEHTSISVDAAAQLCSSALAIGITPLVRTAGHNHHDASRLLDSGSLGIIYPRVSTAAEAKAFVSACKFPPLGHRSVAGVGPTNRYRAAPLGELNDHGNALALCIAMIETPDGVENAEDIAAVPGIDVLLIGSSDLSTELGIPGKLRDPLVTAAYEKVAAACRKHGKVFGIGGVRQDHELTAHLIKLGALFMIGGGDVGYLMAAAKKDVVQLRAIADEI